MLIPAVARARCFILQLSSRILQLHGPGLPFDGARLSAESVRQNAFSGRRRTLFWDEKIIREMAAYKKMWENVSRVRAREIGGGGVYCARCNSKQRNHGDALRVMDQAHDWIEHTVPGQSPQLPCCFTRHPHAQHAVDAGRALQLKRHNIAGRK